MLLLPALGTKGTSNSGSETATRLESQLRYMDHKPFSDTAAATTTGRTRAFFKGGYLVTFTIPHSQEVSALLGFRAGVVSACKKGAFGAMKSDEVT